MKPLSHDPNGFSIADAVKVAKAVHGEDVERNDVRTFVAYGGTGQPGAGPRNATLYFLSEIIAIAALAPFGGALYNLRPRAWRQDPDLDRRPEAVRDAWVATIRQALNVVEPDPDKPLFLVTSWGSEPGSARSVTVRRARNESNEAVHLKLRRKIESRSAAIVVDLAKVRRTAISTLLKVA